jgi:NAD(P)-dependent dehydrogenase (short-subunit alcohol dehydrogenase family)
VIVITGANRGLGLELTRVLSRAGAHVVMACRNPERAESAKREVLLELPLARITTVELDLSDLRQVRECANRLRSAGSVPDVLINNAGIYRVPVRHQTADGFELHIGSNHLGHMALTCTLLPDMTTRPGSRIVTVTSLLHRMSRSLPQIDLPAGNHYSPGSAYNRSKLANVLFMQELDRQLRLAEAETISVGAHPGLVQTGLHTTGPQLGRFSLWNALVSTGSLAIGQSVRRGVLPILYAATAPDVAGGTLYAPDGIGELHGCGVKVGRLSPRATAVTASALWAESCRLIAPDLEATSASEHPQLPYEDLVRQPA